MHTRFLMTALVAVLLCAFPAAAQAAAPPTTAQTVFQTGVEDGDPAFDLVPTPGVSEYSWGPITSIKNTGSKSLWVAGKKYPAGTLYMPNPLLYPVPTGDLGGTVGSAYLHLDQLSEYYSSNLSYYYLYPSRGDADTYFSFYYETVPGGQFKRTEPPLVSGWTKQNYDLSSADHNKLFSRRDIDVQFRFQDSSQSNGQGPAVDDFVVTGWKYGPVRSVASVQNGNTFRTTWARPYNSLNETTGDTRTLAYRVWRSPAGTNTWTEVSPVGRLGNSALSFDDPIADEGVSYEYFVQAWDTGTGTGYGQGTKSAAPVSAPAATPNVALSAPAKGFPIDSGAVTVSGTSSDTGSGVGGVGVRIQRNMDGKYWNGSIWTSLESWVTPGTHASDWSTWSLSWTPDAETIAAQDFVYVSARATDVSGRTADTASVPSAATAISLEGGAEYTNKSTDVAVDVGSKTATHMRFRVAGMSDGDWQTFATVAHVNLPTGDGAKSVACDLSTDGGTTFVTKSDTIVLETVVPELAITAPAANFVVNGGVVQGTASDNGAAKVVDVHLVIRSKNAAGTQYYWTGSEWSTSALELPVTTANGWATWSYASAPAAAVWAYSPVEVEAVATDAAGNTVSKIVKSKDELDPVALTISQSATVITSPLSGGYATISGVLTPSSGTAGGKYVKLLYSTNGSTYAQLGSSKATASDGSVSFKVTPKDKTWYKLEFKNGTDAYQDITTGSKTVTPKVYLTKPTKPSRARKNVSFSSYGYIKPLHTSKSTYSSSSAVRVRAYRLSAGKWVYKKTFYAKISRVSSATSKYVVSVKLPYTGTWRLQALAPADSKHYETWSSPTTSFTVK